MTWRIRGQDRTYTPGELRELIRRERTQLTRDLIPAQRQVRDIVARLEELDKALALLGDDDMGEG